MSWQTLNRITLSKLTTNTNFKTKKQDPITSIQTPRKWEEFSLQKTLIKWGIVVKALGIQELNHLITMLIVKATLLSWKKEVYK